MLLGSINNYYPFENNPAAISISTDYPYTSALVKNYPQFGPILRQNSEIFDLVTMRSRINKPNEDAKALSLKTAEYIHLSLVHLMKEPNANLNMLTEIDETFFQMLPNRQDEMQCRAYINAPKSKKKLLAFDYNERQIFDSLPFKVQAAILELNKDDRTDAIHMDPKYYDFFCYLSKDLRTIFLNQRINYMAFNILSHDPDFIKKMISTSSKVELNKLIKNTYAERGPPFKAILPKKPPNILPRIVI